jgi:spermidine synthase
LTYYHRTGPIGQVYETLCPRGTKCETAFIGLGTGTMASYLEPGQHGDFYEIDSAVVRLASDPTYFTYLRDCRGKYDIRLGDARLKMRDARDEKGENKKYRLIVVDAFSSDAIPVHLITKEAIEMYFQHLEPDGILAIHISNRHLRLGPVLGKIADEIGKTALREYDDDDKFYPGKNTSDWVVMANNSAALAALREKYLEDNKKDSRWRRVEMRPGQKLWTDDFSDIVGVLRWWE